MALPGVSCAGVGDRSERGGVFDVEDRDRRDGRGEQDDGGLVDGAKKVTSLWALLRAARHCGGDIVAFKEVWEAVPELARRGEPLS